MIQSRDVAKPAGAHVHVPAPHAHNECLQESIRSSEAGTHPRRGQESWTRCSGTPSSSRGRTCACTGSTCANTPAEMFLAKISRRDVRHDAPSHVEVLDDRAPRSLDVRLHLLARLYAPRDEVLREPRVELRLEPLRQVDLVWHGTEYIACAVRGWETRLRSRCDTSAGLMIRAAPGTGRCRIASRPSIADRPPRSQTSRTCTDWPTPCPCGSRRP